MHLENVCWFLWRKELNRALEFHPFRVMNVEFLNFTFDLRCFYFISFSMILVMSVVICFLL